MMEGRKMTKWMTAVLVFLPMVALADPAPFGLEIGNATIEDVKQKYNAKRTGINKYSNGEMYDLDVSRIELDGLQSATVIFSQDGKLLAVLTTLTKKKFDYLFDSLSRKYSLISKRIPFVGSKSARFVDGNTEITLYAPHLSFQMKMSYINMELQKQFESQSDEEQQRKQVREMDQL